METGIYVALSGQLAAQRRLETIAHNLANANTPGFRSEEIKFSSLLSSATADPVSFASTGESYFSRRSGGVMHTGNPLDVAISGEAWLAVETAAGLAYTRDGRMKVSPNGELLSVNDYRFTDVGGAPLVVNARGGPLEIAPDGTIIQDGVARGQIGLFQINDAAKLTRFDNSALLSDIPGVAIVDANQVSLQQGFLEQSNVNAMMELSRLIQLTRNFDAVSATVDQSNQALKEAIRALGSRS